MLLVRGGGVALKLAPVVLHEVSLFSVTVTGAKLILVHLCKHLVQVPIIVLKSINRAYHACPVTSAGAVNVELTCFRIVNNLQERVDLVHAGIALINHRNVDVAEAGTLHRGLLVFPGIIGQVNDRFDPERSKSRIVSFFRTATAVKPVIHLAKIFDLNVSESFVFAFAVGQAGKAIIRVKIAMMAGENFFIELIKNSSKSKSVQI